MQFLPPVSTMVSLLSITTEPASQCSQSLESVAPILWPNRPLLQATHAVSLDAPVVGKKKPALQLLQAEVPGLSENSPAEHKMQFAEFGCPWNCPAEHGTQIRLLILQWQGLIFPVLLAHAWHTKLLLLISSSLRIVPGGQPPMHPDVSRSLAALHADGNCPAGHALCALNLQAIHATFVAELYLFAWQLIQATASACPMLV